MNTGVLVSALGELIQRALDAQPGLTVADLARRSELTPQLIYGWLNGTRIVKTPMRPDTAAGLARGLRVPEVVVWDAVLKDLGTTTRLVPDDISPERAVLIASLTALPEAEIKRITAIVRTYLDDED